MLGIWMRRTIALQIAAGMLTFGVFGWMHGVTQTDFQTVLRDGMVLWSMILAPIVLAAVGWWLTPDDAVVGPHHSGRSEGAMVFALGLSAAFGAGVLFFVRILLYVGPHPTLLASLLVACVLAWYHARLARISAV